MTSIGTGCLFGDDREEATDGSAATEIMLTGRPSPRAVPLASISAESSCTASVARRILSVTLLGFSSPGKPVLTDRHTMALHADAPTVRTGESGHTQGHNGTVMQSPFEYPRSTADDRSHDLRFCTSIRRKMTSSAT